MTSYLGISRITPVAADQVPVGQIAYFTRDRQWMLSASVAEKSVLIVLTGERAPTIYSPAAYGSETAVMIDGWRIEIDPNSLDEGTFGVRSGCAFVSESKMGFYASYLDARWGHQATGFGNDGLSHSPVQGAPAAVARRWRIVTGDEKDPFIICSFDLPSQD